MSTRVKIMHCISASCVLTSIIVMGVVLAKFYGVLVV